MRKAVVFALAAAFLKRPRLTPNPSMVTKDGKLSMTIGTPGGDMQPQIKSRNFPDSFVLHDGNITTGAVCAIIRDTGKLIGADPREEAVAKGE